MPIEVQCTCGRKCSVAAQHAGKRAKCPACGAVMVVPSVTRATLPDVAHLDELAEAAFDPFEDVKAPAEKPTEAPPLKRYKVLTQKDKWFSGKFDPERLEQAINAYADQGWTVKSAVTASFPGFIGGNRDELIVILER
jgi:hypothetical protein